MRKTSVFLLIFVGLLLASCGKLTTASDLKVTDKGRSDNGFWIEAYDPINETEEVAFKIMVDDERVWNLIEEDREYYIMYSKKGNKPWNLAQIHHNLEPE